MHHGCCWQRMESERSGDLGDIVRSGGVCTDRDLSSENRCSEAFDFRREGPPTSPVPEAKVFPPPLQQFSAPLPSLPDPLLPESLGPVSYEGVDMSAPSLYGGQNGLLAAHTAVEEEMCRRPCDMLSRVLQISPAMRAATSPPGQRGIQRPPPVLLGNAVNLNNPAVPDGATTGQIPSPRSQGIKRRKSQAKKVVCIPAPANTGSRQSGEVVPSDLWAWRKYGQKPIKGSPYPRGYYRCSSSKGCSARKQVERSRTDPNMLVITYTSEHNHPWPTHRNALAGSTRSHPSKIPSSSNTSRSTSMIDIPRGEHVESTSACSSEQSAVKEEGTDHIDQTTAKEPHGSEQPEHVFRQPVHSDDQHLFADLGELGPDPMDLLFSKEFLGDRLEEEMRMGKPLDPFSLFDWDGDSFDAEANKGDL